MARRKITVRKVGERPSGFTEQAPFADTTPVSQSEPAGLDGQYIYSGFIYQAEKRRELRDREKWTTFDNIVANIGIVSAAIGIWTDLAGSAKWTVKPNPRGGKDAEKCAELIYDGTIGATLSKPWRNVIKRQLIKKFRGFALHEVLVRRRDDGVVVLKDLQHRPQWTVYRWDKPDPQTPWQGIEQRGRSGEKSTVPRSRLFYSVEDTLTDSPDGVGLLRYMVEDADAYQRYRQLEGIGFDTDLRGMPIGRAPLAKMVDYAKAAGCKTKDEIQTWIDTRLKPLQNLLSGHVKTTEQSLLLDSAVYATLDQARTPSSIFEWSFDVVKAAASTMSEIGPASRSLLESIARIMSAEFLILGGGGSGGSHAQHADKTSMFGLRVNSSCDDVGDDATRDIATRLTILNDYDPETCTPTFEHEPVATESVLETCQALAALAQAGAVLPPNWKGVNVLLDRMDLPDLPEQDLATLIAPRTKQPPVPPPATSPTPTPPGTPKTEGAPAGEDATKAKDAKAQPTTEAAKPGGAETEPTKQEAA